MNPERFEFCVATARGVRNIAFDSGFMEIVVEGGFDPWVLKLGEEIIELTEGDFEDIWIENRFRVGEDKRLAEGDWPRPGMSLKVIYKGKTYHAGCLHAY